jgi:hypothetical protein
MAEPVLDSLVATLEKYDKAVLQGAQGRRQHVGASADLDTVADEIVQVVRLLDGYHRLQFGRDPELMAAWESASSVVANPQRSAEVPPGGVCGWYAAGSRTAGGCEAGGVGWCGMGRRRSRAG